MRGLPLLGFEGETGCGQGDVFADAGLEIRARPVGLEELDGEGGDGFTEGTSDHSGVQSREPQDGQKPCHPHMENRP